MAEKDKARYEKEIAASGAKPTKAMQKKAKDSGASGPKKSLSAYFWFCAEQRPIMNEKFPDSSMTDKTKKMSAIWNGLTDEKKKKYQELADKDKARYER